MIDPSVVGAKLVLLRPDGTEETCFDFVNELTIGRGTGCDVSIKAKVVSRKHAAIRFNENGQFILHHLSATNPSAVNGMNVIGEHTLRDSDMVSFGDKIFQFRATDPNRYSPAVSRTNSACNKHLPVLETIHESSPSGKEDVSTGKSAPSTKGLPNSIMADIQKRRKSGAAPAAVIIAAAEASPGKSEASEANHINEAKKIPFSIKEAIEKRRVSLTQPSAVMAVEEVIPPTAAKVSTTTPRKSLPSSSKTGKDEGNSAAVMMKKMSTPLRRAVKARLEAEKMYSPPPQKEESQPSVVLQATTPREKKVMKIPTPLRMSIVALRRKSLPAARPESAKKNTPVAAAAAESEKPRLALPTPVREQICAARMSISYSEVVPSVRRQSSSPQRRISSGRRLLFEQLPLLPPSPGVVGDCPSVTKARKSLRQSLSDANATPMEIAAPAEELFQEDCIVAASVQISALAAVKELPSEVTASEEVIERAVAAILSPSAVQSSERSEEINEVPASLSKRAQTPSELKALRRASDASIISTLSVEEIELVEQYSEMLPKDEDVEANQEQETENFAVALDAYVRGIECAQTLSATTTAEEVAADKSEEHIAVNEDFPSLAKLFTLPASFVDATYSGFDEDLVELYAQEIMEAANVDEAVAYGVALDSFLADPVLFRNHIGALAMPHLIYMQHEDKEIVEAGDVTLPENAMDVDEVVTADTCSAEGFNEGPDVAITNQSIVQESNKVTEEAKEDNTTRIAIEFIGTTPASSRYPSRRTTIQASTQKSTVKNSARKSIAFAEESTTPVAPHSVQKELNVEEVKVVASRSRRASKAAIAEEAQEASVIEATEVVKEVVQPTPAPSRTVSRRTSRAAQSLILTPAVEPVAALICSMKDEVVVTFESSAMDVEETVVSNEQASTEPIEQIATVEVKPVVDERSAANTKKRGRGGKASKPVAEEVTVVEPAVVAAPVIEVVVEEPIAPSTSTAIDTEEEEEIVVEVILCDKCDGEFTLEEAGLDSIPEGDWFCASCEPKKRRGGRVSAPAGKTALKKPTTSTKKAAHTVPVVVDSVEVEVEKPVEVIVAPTKRGGRKAAVVAAIPEPESEPEVATASRATRSTRSKKA